MPQAVSKGYAEFLTSKRIRGDGDPLLATGGANIDGYEFRGMGCCENAEQEYYPYETVSGGTVEECAAACKENYSSDPYFVGINFHPDWFGSANCNCMRDTNGNGAITSAGGWCDEELCYSYNEANPPAPLCDSNTQETCFDQDGMPESCAAWEVGCPCPTGEERCGGSEYWPGYCTSVCCDDETQETCFDEDWNVTCEDLANGGCPCSAGEEKCGGNENSTGWCTTLCCEPPQTTCYNDNYDPVQCAASESECPAHLKAKYVEKVVS